MPFLSEGFAQKIAFDVDVSAMRTGSRDLVWKMPAYPLFLLTEFSNRLVGDTGIENLDSLLLEPF